MILSAKVTGFSKLAVSANYNIRPRRAMLPITAIAQE
jgi:hypothetical protein